MRYLTKFFLIFLFVGNTFSALTQDFLTLGNEWIFEYNEYIGSSAYLQSIESIKVTKDTIIGGLQYQKLESTRTAPCAIFRKVEFLRAENGKIYRRNEDLAGELMMIDFDATDSYEMLHEIAYGDQIIETTVLKDSIGIEILDSGDTLDIQYLRIENNQSYGDDPTYKLSRRIGFLGLRSLLFPDIGTGLCDTPQWAQMRCHINGQDTLHFFKDVDCSEIYIVNSTNQINDSDIKVFPNPAKDHVVISSEEAVIKSFQIYNVNGLLVVEKELDQLTNRIEINASDWNKGIYYIHIQMPKSISTHTFVKL